MQDYDQTDPRYKAAKKRVKEIKGFYTHAAVYVLVNLFLLALNVQQGESVANLDNYWTAILWGVGLLAHGLSVFLPQIIFGRDWEERKTRELMDKYK